MNERIKLLAEQATIYIEPTPTSGEGWIFNKEKFAQLIIRDCVDIAHGSDTPVQDIIDHFGINV